MITIAKTFTFDAAHHLPTVPEDHKCHRMHGHTYSVELQFRGEVGDNGFCEGIDYADIARSWTRIFDLIDHRILNDVPGLEIPSTEVLVVWIADRFIDSAETEKEKELSRALYRVRVCESSTTWCEYEVP